MEHHAPPANPVGQLEPLADNPAWFEALMPLAKKPRRTTPPFLLGNSLGVVPGRVVDKIAAREYVDLAELLPDNAELLRREGERDKWPLATAGSRSLRRITSIAQWVHAFAAFAAVEVSQRPSRALEMLGYIRLVVRLTEKCHSRNPLGWLSYDTFFRQKAAAEQNLSWAKQDTDLVTDHVLSPEDAACSICGAGDHKAAVCSLRPTESGATASPRAAAFPSAAGNAGSRRPQKSEPCRLFNFAPTGCGYGSRCVFRHVCDKCGNKGHRAAECQATGKQQQQPAPQGPRAQSPRPQ